jgi:hypothetical protein
MAVFAGQRLNLTAEFKTEGVPFNPASLEFRVRKPDATLTTIAYPHADITNPTVGTFILSYLFVTAGTYYVAVASLPPPVEAVDEMGIVVQTPRA